MKPSRKLYILWGIQIAAAMANLIVFAINPNWVSLVAGGVCILCAIPTFVWYREVRGYEA